jgi:membrane-associated phospholipid phosphatase
VRPVTGGPAGTLGGALEEKDTPRDSDPERADPEGAQLGRVAEDVDVAGISIEGRRRRPSGERAPLDYQLGRSGVFWLTAAVATIALWAVFVASNIADPLIQRVDDAILRWLERLRVGWLTTAARWVAILGSTWALLTLRWTTIAALAVLRRLRHLLTFVGSVLAVRLVVWVMSTGLGRPPPTSVRTIGEWRGYADPSVPVAMLAVTLIGMSFALAPSGRPRSWALRASAVAIVMLGLAQTYLGVSHPSDVLAGAALGVAFAIVPFRVACPDAVFPVSYQRGRRTAHLELDEHRIDGIRSALEVQMEAELVHIEHVGLEGSGGSTPLLITLRDPSGELVLFGKLYADTHVRADRWYKLGREILYGSLEDETSFNSVRQLVEYEDYMMRVMHAAKLPTPRSRGFVELWPEREYVILSDYVPRAEEADEAPITSDVIEQGLRVVRRMWDEGLAHRDIKPANILIRDDTLHLIDVAFGQVRPSTWRQAVDLANMMLVLALGSDAATVYGRAEEMFDPGDIGEAFAATRGVTMPAQLRQSLDEDGRDLVAEFRELAPERPPIRVQRWSVRRVAITARTLAIGVVIAALTIVNLANPAAP